MQHPSFQTMRHATATSSIKGREIQKPLPNDALTKKTANAAGFSIAELMVAMVIFSFVMIATLSGTLVFSRMYASVASTTDQQAIKRWVTNHISPDVWSSTQITKDFDDQFTISLSNGSTAIYRFYAQANNDLYTLNRNSAGNSVHLLSDVKRWAITLPAPDLPFSLSLVIDGINSLGETEEITIFTSAQPRI